MKRDRTALVLAMACLCAACASRSSGGGVCTVPAAICQANPATSAPGSPPTCGLCPAEDLIQWIERKGCQYGPNLSCAQGQIYGYQGSSYCCQTPPYSSGAAPAGGTAAPRTRRRPAGGESRSSKEPLASNRPIVLFSSLPC